MRKINPQVTRFGLIALGASLLIYALNVAENTNTELSNEALLNEQNQKPSAYLTESTFNMFSADGKLSKLHVAKAFFYSNKDAITIQSPTFTTNNSVSGMQLTADKGFYNPAEETLVLEGNVIARQIGQVGTSWVLNSETLNLDNKLGTLSTNEEVHFSNGTHSLKAIGFVGSINEKEIKLLSKVRGKYVF
tara:strand:+ start:31177 stop:31749 length:573 start_codon:yes stop_codon:yes gene_type:complete